MSRHQHGGARKGAGRPRAGEERQTDDLDFDKHRARNEAAKADLNELEFKIKSGEYIPRDAVKQAAATLLSSLAQSLRSLPDTLERKVNMTPEAAELVEKTIDAVLSDLSEELSLMVNQP